MEQSNAEENLVELLQKFKLNLLPITVNMTHVTDNWKARKRKNYADVVKVTQTQPLVSESNSSHVNEKNGENQVDIEKIKSLLMIFFNIYINIIMVLHRHILN